MVNELFGINVTTYDKEDDIHFIKQQLRERIDELKKLANDWVDKGTIFLDENRAVLYTDEILKLENSVQLLAKGIADGELDDVETDVYMLEEDMSTILPQLDKRKTNLNNARSLLSKVEGELNSLQDKMSDEQKAQINNKIAAFKLKIDQKAFTELSTASEELNAYWDYLKNNLSEKPKPTPSSEPTTTNDPAPTSTPIATDNPEHTSTPTVTPTPSKIPTPVPSTNPIPAQSSEPTQSPEPTTPNGGESIDAGDDINT